MKASELAGIVALFVVTVLPHAWAVSEPLNGVDAIPSVAAARVESLSEVPSLLVQELRGGAQFDGAYWRPTTTLVYAADFAVWGWEPFGYHLTDLILAGLATLGVYALTRVALGRGVWFAAAVALLFALHPSSIEVVPSVSRRQEPLLVIAFALALIGASRLPTRRGLALHLAGCAMAVTCVERGLVIPALVASYLALCHPGGGDAWQRLRRSAMWTMPSAAIALGFYGLRWALFGSSGIVLHASSFSRIPTNLFSWLVYPQQFFDFRLPDSAAGGAALAAIAIVVAAALVLALWRSSEIWLLAFCAAWIASYTLLVTIAGQVHAWYPYSAAPALAIAIVALGARGVAALWRRAPSLSSIASVSVAAGLAFASSVGSPLWVDYSEWRVIDRLSTRFLSELERVSAETPADASLAIVNLPSAYLESDEDWGVTRTAAGLWPRSVRTWASVKGITRELSILGAANFVGEIEVPQLELGEEGLGVWFRSGRSKYFNPDPGGPVVASRRKQGGMSFAWPPRGVAAPILVFAFDGDALVPISLESRRPRRRPTSRAPTAARGASLHSHGRVRRRDPAGA
ncbi:MAG TPA: hypothetical protein VFT98_05140 [Myxococcota bacterium]|nr:hypothetical protein [Myxococcota bacterium]